MQPESFIPAAPFYSTGKAGLPPPLSPGAAAHDSIFLRNRLIASPAFPSLSRIGTPIPASHQHRNQPQDEAFVFIGLSTVPGGGIIFYHAMPELHPLMIQFPKLQPSSFSITT
jgi:hypothetical protein